MRKNILILLLTGKSLCLLYGQTLKFNYTGFSDSIPCNVFKKEPGSFLGQSSGWKVSHGSPSVGDPYNSSLDMAKLTASNDGDETSDGLYIAYNFVQGHTYVVIVGNVAGDANSGIRIEILATNGLTESTDDSCDQGSIPDDPADLYVIMSDYAQVASAPLQMGSYTKTWVADKKYSQLWIRSRQLGNGRIGSVAYIDEIVVEDLGIVSSGNSGSTGSSQKPPPPVLSYSSVTSSSFYVDWQQNGYTSYNVSLNKTKQYDGTGNDGYVDTGLSTTNGGHFPFRGLQPCTQYEVDVYRLGAGLVFSDPATIYVTTASKYVSDITLNNGGNGFPVITASNSITLQSGFHYKATVLSPLLLDIINCTTNPSGRTGNSGIISAQPVKSNSSDIIVKVYYKEPKVMLFPNPVETEFTISVQPEISYGVSIQTITGQPIKSWAGQKSKSKFNIEGVQSGLYLVEITSDFGRQVYKIMKK